MNAVADVIKDLSSLLLSCCLPAPYIKFKGVNYKILRLIGEGGFSYVYLVKDPNTASLFAVKQIRCALGQENLDQALREVDAYHLFNHKSIIKCLVCHDRSEF